VKDFEPIALLASDPIVAKKTIPAQDLREFIAWLKANPGKAAQGAAGIGSPAHVSGVYFQRLNGTTFQFVPYRGAAPAKQDLVGGHIDHAALWPRATAGGKARHVARARPAFDAGPGFWLSCRKLARLRDVMGERATSRSYSGSCRQ
jgi:hypothetical protein